MTLLIHRCRECGHADHEHDEQSYKGRPCSYGYCTCSNVQADVRREPTVAIPRFGDDRQPIAHVAKPGSRLVENPQAGVVWACGCDSCHAAYAQMTEVPA